MIKAKFPTYLGRSHSHNDYNRNRPLQDALARGFASIEADIFLLDGELRVGHTEQEARENRTLKEMYLEPLRAHIEAHEGRVFEGEESLSLLVDVKTEAYTTYPVLKEQLAEYSDILTEYKDGEVLKDPVRVIVSGNVAREEIAQESHRYLAVDGRLDDLTKETDPQLVPMVSQSWQEHFLWHGFIPMPGSERRKLRALVEKAHAQGKDIRFWGTPDREDIWREELEAGVDFINADNLGKLERFLISNNPSVCSAGKSSTPPAL